MPKIEIDIPQGVLDELPKGDEFYIQPGTLGKWGHLAVRPQKPWYPQEWIDDPKLGVHEMRPGEWPPCKPGDVIEVLYAGEREQKIAPRRPVMHADGFFWVSSKVAIRIHGRAGE